MTMKTFQQFQEESGLTGDSSEWSKGQVSALGGKLEKVRKLPGQVVDAAKAAKADAEAKKEKEQLKKDREEERKERESDRAEDRRRKEELHQAKMAKIKQGAAAG